MPTTVRHNPVALKLSLWNPMELLVAVFRSASEYRPMLRSIGSVPAFE